MKIFFPSATLAILALVWSSSNVSAQAGKGGNVVKNGSTVSLEYTLSDDKGKVIESNRGKTPMVYVQGQGQIIPGLEKALEGMALGTQKNVRVKPEEGYGPVDPNAFREVPKENLPPDALKVGTELVARNAQGQSFPVRVHEIKEKTAVIDLNHPMAGKTLLFDVKILDIKRPESK
jgi:FKBP-type peptidyl-prolyl cis-trans isomerase SlyD